MTGELGQPMNIDPNFPPPDPARVALLLALEWPKSDDPLQVIEGVTIDGRPLSDDEQRMFGACTPNDLAVMVQLSYAESEIAMEQALAWKRATELLRRYGFVGDDVTIEQIRPRMSVEDGAEFDALGDLIWPDGYIWLDGPADG